MSKKKATGKPKDQHKSQFMVRLPIQARAMLNEMVRASRRAYTQELLLALEDAYKRFQSQRAEKPSEGETGSRADR